MLLKLHEKYLGGEDAISMVANISKMPQYFKDAAIDNTIFQKMPTIDF